jgi:hypothetical protein
MTCRGYDSRAIKLPKEVKRRAATILDNHQRGEFMRSWVVIYQEASRSKGSNKKQSKED